MERTNYIEYHQFFFSRQFINLSISGTGDFILDIIPLCPLFGSFKSPLPEQFPFGFLLRLLDPFRFFLLWDASE